MAVSFAHLPVLADSVVEAFSGLPGQPAGADAGEALLLDCTLGGGGHSALLLAAHPALRLIGLDRDPAARAAAAERLAPFGDRAVIQAANFADFTPPAPLVGVLADLGVSSPQLDEPTRGFSFRAPGPLDMRMDPAAGETAAELIDRLEESALADLIHGYGEERLSRRIARRLVAERPWAGSGRTTADLAYAVAGCFPPRRAMAGSTRPPAPSRPCGSRSTTSWAPSTGCWSGPPTGWCRGAAGGDQLPLPRGPARQDGLPQRSPPGAAHPQAAGGQ